LFDFASHAYQHHPAEICSRSYFHGCVSTPYFLGAAPAGDHTPYPAAHRPEVKKIIESARRLFNRPGFDNVSLQRIMAGANLPTAASTATSKADLYAEVLGCFFTDPN
jgi:Bacterial regulatory proteins, tetR family